MNKEILINQVIGILEKCGFSVSERCNIRPRSFDIAARLEKKMLLIKVISNIDGLKEGTAEEMRLIAENLNGSPFIIAEKSRDHPLESSVVYYRYNLPSINIETFYDYFIEELAPIVYAAPGGLYVGIDGSLLRDIRIRHNLSIGALAAELGVSRRAISKYEEEDMDMSVDMVLRLYEIFNETIATVIDFLHPKKSSRPFKIQPAETQLGISIKFMLSDLGCDVIPISQAPFNAVSSEHKDNVNNKSLITILTGYSNYSGAMIKRAKLMSSISEVTNTQSMFIINGPCKYEHVDNTVLVEKNELKAMDDFEDLINYIYEKIPPT
ncbi:MAG: transcriptional regulator [Methanosarcinales archaeon]|nr:transcriptional regulator [Methanosarcinales archaeon]